MYAMQVARQAAKYLLQVPLIQIVGMNSWLLANILEFDQSSIDKIQLFILIIIVILVIIISR